MTALTRYFFHDVDVPRGTWEVVRWWEHRRLAYNAAVGGAGLVTLGVTMLLVGLPPLRALPGLLLFVGVYGLLANLCYSLGPVLDLLARRWGGSTWAAVGPALLRYGFVFAVGLTLIPIPMVVLARIAEVVLG